MRPVGSFYRTFLEKQINSAWNSGFFWGGAMTGSLAITYLRIREKKKPYDSTTHG